MSADASKSGSALPAAHGPATSARPAGGSSVLRLLVTGVAALVGLAAFVFVAAAALAVALVGAVVAAIALIGRSSRRTSTPGLLEGRRTADGWTVEPAR
ncbi:MAG: hypothetical protein KJS97_01105 [Alphaproteobacteria bacterium]|nr:hypothetical protein [Alphaproteobacteria bacterium]